MSRIKASGKLCPRSLLQKLQAHFGKARSLKSVEWAGGAMRPCFVVLPVADGLKHIQSDVVQSEVEIMSVGDLGGERNDMEWSIKGGK